MDATRLSAKQVWLAALERVRGRVSAASYTTWFKATEGWEYGPGELVVAAPNGFAAGHLQQRFRDTAQSCLADVLGRALDVRFVVRPAGRPDATREAAHGAEGGPTAATGEREIVAAPLRGRGSGGDSGRASRSTDRSRGQRRERIAATLPPRSPLPGHEALAQPPLMAPNMAGGGHPGSGQPPVAAASTPLVDGSLAMSGQPGLARSPNVSGPTGADPNGRHTFESFVVGITNRLAYAAAVQVATAPGASYNPLFIYGGTGLGKTHLLLAIGHEARRKGLNVCYVPAERFANDIIEAIRHHNTEAFRARYRAVDVLLVDDIQFIAGKESTEEEFFHTFNALHESNRQIVLSSDRVPRAMRHLHDRLRSRFEWGLLADIQPPDVEHRMAILRAKATVLGVRIADREMEAIAQPECASVRELEGALNRVLAYAAMMGSAVDQDIVARALGPLRSGPRHEVTSERVLATITRHFDVTPEALRGKARDHAVAWPRQVAMYLMRESTPLSLSQIGESLGGRDHTTVMHGCSHVAAEVKAKAHIRQDVDDLLAELHA